MKTEVIKKRDDAKRQQSAPALRAGLIRRFDRVLLLLNQLTKWLQQPRVNRRPLIFQQRSYCVLIVSFVGGGQTLAEREKARNLAIDLCDKIARFRRHYLILGGLFEVGPLHRQVRDSFLQLNVRSHSRHLVEQYAGHAETNFLEVTVNLLDGTSRLHAVFVHRGKRLNAGFHAVDVDGHEQRRRRHSSDGKRQYASLHGL